MKVAIFGIGIIATLLLFTAGIIFNSHRVAAIWVIFATVVAYALSFSLYWHNDINSNVNTAPKPVLKKPIFSENIDTFTFSLGERGFSSGYSVEALKEPKEPYNFGKYKPVKLYIKDGNLFADVKIYGGSNLPPIEIVQNELSNKPHDWDFNSNNKALEIVDKNKNPIYQFFYKTPAHIVVNGIFPFPGGLILANDQGAVINPSLPTNFKLKRIFKYPSWQYPGEYEK